MMEILDENAPEYFSPEVWSEWWRENILDNDEALCFSTELEPD